MTKIETKFRITQISVVDILKLLALVRADNAPGNVTLVLAPPAGVLASKYSNNPPECFWMWNKTRNIIRSNVERRTEME